MNIESKILITLLLIVISILIVINVSMKMKLDKQIETGKLLRDEIEKSMVTKEELVGYLTNISGVMNAYQKYRNEILDSISSYKFPVLIYGYPEKECGMCVNKDLRQLYDFQEIVGEEHIRVISIFSQNRNNETRLKSELSSFKFKNIHNMSDVMHRFYALINKDKNIEMIFIPEVNMPDLSNAYFDAIKDRFGRNVSN